MADEDLFSLDFTMPEAAPAPPPAVSQSPVELPKPSLELVDVDAPTVAPVGALVAAPAESAPTFPQVLREAADLHAAGDFLNASRRLEGALKAGGQSEEATDLIWRALFEVLQDLNRRDAFDKLAMAYARHFEVSPPTWVAPVGDLAEPVQDDVSRFAFPEVLDASVGTALKQLMRLARAHQLLHIDLRPVREADESGCTLLLRALKALDAAGRNYDLDGADALAALLSSKVEMLVRANEPIWMLLLELYECMGQQAAFEDTAVNYAVTFEVSPPSWEVRPSKLAVSSSVPKVEAGRDAAPMPLLSGELVGMIGALPVSAERELILDATNLQRLDESAAASLLAALKQVKAAGQKLAIINLPPLPYVYLNEQGLAQAASLNLRKA